MERLFNSQQLLEAFTLALSIAGRPGTLVSVNLHRGELEIEVTTPSEHYSFKLLGKEEYQVRNESELRILRELKQELETSIIIAERDSETGAAIVSKGQKDASFFSPYC
jgi:hypothetical protein